MQPDATWGRLATVAPHPLAELLACPPLIENRLNGSARSIDCQPGEVVFQQSNICKGLYLVITGLFQRKTERLECRLTLGPARPGDLVELAAALGEGNHTYTLTAVVPGSLVLLPEDALTQAFEAYPLLRMHLLEELAREVSRGYNASRQTRIVKPRRRSFADSAATE